jgi:hypothetical protein
MMITGYSEQNLWKFCGLLCVHMLMDDDDDDDHQTVLGRTAVSIMVEWLSLLACIWEALRTSSDPDTIYTD